MALVAAVTLAAVTPGIALAARNFHGAVVVTGGTPLNLRASPGGDVKGQLANGSRVTVFNRSDAWVEVATADGSRGWVHGDYLGARLAGFRIVVDPGHGGYDGGAYANGVIERDVNLLISKYLGALLEQRGAQVRMTREGQWPDRALYDPDDPYNPETRTGMANAWPAHALLSVHNNSAGSNASVRGHMTIWGNAPNSQPLAQVIHDRVLSLATARGYDLKDRGVWRDTQISGRTLAITNRSLVPATIIEGAYVTNPDDAALLKNDAFLRTMAEGIADGTGQFLFRHNVLPEIRSLTMSRVFGEDRYQSAIELSRRWSQASTVVLATGEDFPDALSAAPLAAAVGGPLLLTRREQLPPGVLDRVRQLGASRVVIVGGEGVVGDEVAQQLQRAGLRVDRIGGSDRFETSAEVARALAALSRPAKVAIANGMTFADAMAISAYAARAKIPVLLTLADRLPPETRAVLKELAPQATFVIGGTGVISKAVEAELPNPTRLGGDDRYETSQLIAERLGPGGAEVILARGDLFPDALTAGAAAALSGSAFLLIDPNVVRDAIPAYLKGRNGEISKLTVIGGREVISDAHVAQHLYRVGW